MKLRAAVVQWLVEIRRLSSNDSGLSSSLESPKGAKGIVETGTCGEEHIVSGQSLAVVLLYYQQLKDRYVKSIREAPREMLHRLTAADREVRKGNRKARVALWTACFSFLSFCYGVDVSEESQQRILKGDEHTVATLLFTVHNKLKRLHPRRTDAKKNVQRRLKPISVRRSPPKDPSNLDAPSCAPATTAPPTPELATLGLDEQFAALGSQDRKHNEQETQCLGRVFVECTRSAFDLDVDGAIQYLREGVHSALTERLTGTEQAKEECAYRWCMLLFSCSKRISGGILATDPAVQRLTIHRVLVLLSPPLLSPFRCVVSAVGGVFARVCYDLAVAGFHEEMWIWFVGARNTGFQAMARACRRHGYRVVMDLFPLLDIVCRRFFHLLFGVHLQTAVSIAILPQDLLLLCAHLLPLIAASPASKKAFVQAGSVSNLLATVQWLQQKRLHCSGNRGDLPRAVDHAVQELLASLVLNFEKDMTELREEVVHCLKTAMQSRFIEDQVCACAILFTLLASQQEMRSFVYRSMVLLYVQETAGECANETVIDFIRDNFIVAHATLPDLPVFALIKHIRLQRVTLCSKDFELLLTLVSHPQFDANDAARLLHRLFPLALSDPVFAGPARQCILHCLGRFYFKLEILTAVDGMLHKAMKSGFCNQDDTLLDCVLGALLSMPFKSLTERVQAIVNSVYVGRSHTRKEEKEVDATAEMRSVIQPKSRRLQPLGERRGEHGLKDEQRETFRISGLLRAWNSALFKTFLYFIHSDRTNGQLNAPHEMHMSVAQFNRFCLCCKLQPRVVNRRETLQLFNRDKPHFGGAHFVHFQQCVIRVISKDAFDSFTKNTEGSLGRVLQFVSLVYNALLCEKMQARSVVQKSRSEAAIEAFLKRDRAFLADIALERPPEASPLLAIQRRLHLDVKRLFNVPQLKRDREPRNRRKERCCVVTGAIIKADAIEAALEVIDTVLLEAVSTSFLLRDEDVAGRGRTGMDDLAMPKHRTKKAVDVKHERRADTLAAEIFRLRRQKMLERKLLRYQKEKRERDREEMKMHQDEMERKRRALKEKAKAFERRLAKEKEKGQEQSKDSSRRRTMRAIADVKVEGKVDESTHVVKPFALADAVLAVAEDTWQTVLKAAVANDRPTEI